MRALLVLTISIFLILSGCSYALWKYNPESKINIKITGVKEPQEYSIRVVKDDQAQQEFKVTENGNVSFIFPTLPRCCDVYLFGLIKIKDRDPYKRKVIWVVKKSSIVNKLSYNDISKLEKDENNYYLLRPND